MDAQALADALYEAKCALSTIVGMGKSPNAAHEIQCTALAALARIHAQEQPNGAEHD